MTPRRFALLSPDQQGKVVLGSQQSVNRHVEDVVVGAIELTFVQIVAGTGGVSQELLDRHRRIHVGQVPCNYIAKATIEVEQSFLDERNDGERSETFGTARRAESCVERDRTTFGPIRQTTGEPEDEYPIDADKNDTRVLRRLDGGRQFGDELVDYPTSIASRSPARGQHAAKVLESNTFGASRRPQHDHHAASLRRPQP